MKVNMSNIFQEYEKQLEYHDWYYEMSDDPKVYREGREARQKLEKLAKDCAAIDESKAKELWDKYAKHK